MQLQFELTEAPSTVVCIARANADQFTQRFLEYLPSNTHVFEAFAREALRIRASGRKHYSARTIIEVLRHQSALGEQTGDWKLNDHHTPYLARLFDLVYPGESLWEKRKVRVR